MGVILIFRMLKTQKSGRDLQICPFEKSRNGDKGRKQFCAYDAFASLKVWMIQCPYMNHLHYNQHVKGLTG